jgi:hypothetical protein
MGRYDLDEDTPFLNALSRLNPKDKITIQFLRDGRPLQGTLEVGLR